MKQIKRFRLGAHPDLESDLGKDPSWSVLSLVNAFPLDFFLGKGLGTAIEYA